VETQASPENFFLYPSSSPLHTCEEAEAAVLAAVLLEESLWPRLADGLDRQDFAVERHRLIFDGMERIAQEGQPIDRLTLQARLEEQGTFERAGGLAYVACLDVHLPDLGRIDHYIEIVKDRSIRRQVVALGAQYARAAAETGMSGRDVLAQAETALQTLSARVGVVRLASMGEAAEAAVEALEEGPEEGAELSTGFPALDALTRGLVRGNLLVIAGRPGAGKTSLALSMARDLSLRQGRRAVLFSLEMSAEELALRVLSAEAEIPFQRLVRGVLSHEQWNRVHDAVRTVRRSPLHVGDSSTLSLGELSAAVRRLCWQQAVDVVLVDYLQLMHSGHQHPTEALELGAITRGLKQLAREIHIPVVLLSQLSREPERRGTGSRPKLSDLRGSGSIEQDADLVLFPWPRESPQPPQPQEGNVELIIAKHRNGPTGSLPVLLSRELMDFRPVADT
jgi:replicative DNA helicase